MVTDFENKFKDFFIDLEFEEKSHKYFVNEKPIDISVSGIVDRFKTPFDTNGKSLKKALDLGISQKEVLEIWNNKKERACSLGTSKHSFGERYTFDRNLKPVDGYEEAIVAFWKCIPDYIIPVCVEFKMYHKKYFFAGTCDTVLYNTKTNKYIITDYKTNGELFKNFGNKKLLGIFSDLLENNFNKYQIQLSLYQILFEQLDLQVENRRIVWIKPNGTFSLIDTVDYTDRLNKYLKNYYKC